METIRCIVKDDRISSINVGEFGTVSIDRTHHSSQGWFLPDAPQPQAPVWNEGVFAAGDASGVSQRRGEPT